MVVSQAIRTLLVLLGEHYVERLGAMIFYNPPYIFSSAFSTLSPLLPEPTRQKIKVRASMNLGQD